MSYNSITEFKKALESDKNLLNNLQSIDESTSDKIIDKFITVAEKEGYSFSKNDLNKLLLSIRNNKTNDMLSDKELKSVSGGVSSPDEMNQMINQRNDQIFNMLTNILQNMQDTGNSLTQKQI